jgi:prephenate dehydratase/chorismate mutase/prephenate dehydratase
MNARRIVLPIATLALASTLFGCGTNSAPATGDAAPAAADVTAEKAPAADAEVDAVTTVAYLGPAGTYTEEATKLFFGDGDELEPQETVADALALVADGTVAYAVVPQENALGGPVTDYIDALLATDGVSVVGEVVLPIRQTLMGLPGTDLKDVRKVLSHKQGLAQSAAWLDENLSAAERVEAASTAAAAREVAEGGDLTTVAIAAPGAADLYGLEVLQQNVSKSEANKTRFYVVSREANGLAGYGCAVFVADISAGELPEVLAKACVDGTELTCVHDRPDGTALGSYRYVIELERGGGFSQGELERLKGIGQLEYLGSYARVEG